MLLKTKAGANLVAYILSIDTYITITEKESKLGKMGTSFQNENGKCSLYKLILNLLSKLCKKHL